MSGNGRPTGIRRGIKRTRQRPAAFRKIRAADARIRVTTHACPTSGFHARCLKAARICARRTIAAATGLPHDMRSRSIHPQVMSVFDALGERNQMYHNREERVMSSRHPPGDSHEVAPQSGSGLKRRDLLLSGSSVVAASALSALGLASPAQAQQQPAAPAPAAAGQRPNIVVIMGDDIGIWNIGAYHRGMMAGRTPNLDKLATEGMLFTDYYAEASCTAGRANFITGELPIRTGMTTVGQAGAA